MTLVMSAMILATGLICAAVPSVSSPTVPLGVSVPRVRTSEPVVTRAIRSYRLACVALTLACIVGALLYRFFIALALNSDFIGLQAQDLNLVTAVLVAFALLVPAYKRKLAKLLPAKPKAHTVTIKEA